MFLVIFILILIALILVHEFGHFIVAKAFRIRVDEFGIFFPPRLFAKRFGETEYSFNALPLGGFVRIFGEDRNEAANNPRSFANKPRLVQAAVVVAGVVFNILFAWLAFSLGYMVGLPTAASHEGWGQVRDARPVIVGVYPDSPAARAGLMPKDVVVSLQTGKGESTPENATAKQIREFIAAHQDESVVLSVLRPSTPFDTTQGKSLGASGEEEKVFLTKAEAGLIEGRKAIGIEIDDVGVLQLPPPEALLQGAILTKSTTVAVAQGLGGFFSKLLRGAADFTAVAGPIGIVNFGASAVGQGFAAAVVLTALISINLALINLLPIPGLDGGRLLIIAVESVLRRPVPERLTMALTMTGFALLILLMIVVSYHDIVRLIT